MFKCINVEEHKRRQAFIEPYGKLAGAEAGIVNDAAGEDSF
jgi:hypothetical protein